MTPKTQQLFSSKQQFTKTCPQNFLRNILFKFPKPLKNLKMTNGLAALSLFENSHWKLFCASGVPRYVFAWEFAVFRSVQPQLRKRAVLLKAEAHWFKLGVSLKICLFSWDIEMFWILIGRTSSEHSCKIRYSGKDLSIFVGYWGMCLCSICLLL